MACIVYFELHYLLRFHQNSTGIANAVALLMCCQD